ncbi:MAG: ABC transporter permease, partial [Bacteroidota bacterium]|nr:ABC transporter permease [Bacteroidota bacterium]
LPTILLAFAIIFSFGRNMTSIFLAISLTLWGEVARLVRGQVMYYKELNFVQACHAMGFSKYRVLFKHIIPNILSPIWVSVASNFALAVLLESGLSFIGLGLAAPIPTLGNILQEQYPYALSGKALQAIIPSIVVVLLILSFQLITNHLRDLSDVRMN